MLPYSASAKEFVPTSQTLPVEEGGQTEEDEQLFEGRNCARCNKLFYVFRDTGECVNREECLYHWGKARSSRKYSCCGRRSKSGKIFSVKSLYSTLWILSFDEISDLKHLCNYLG